jgi:hypothetical protein
MYKLPPALTRNSSPSLSFHHYKCIGANNYRTLHVPGGSEAAWLGHETGCCTRNRSSTLNTSSLRSHLLVALLMTSDIVVSKAGSSGSRATASELESARVLLTIGTSTMRSVSVSRQSTRWRFQDTNFNLEKDSDNLSITDAKLWQSCFLLWQHVPRLACNILWSLFTGSLQYKITENDLIYIFIIITILQQLHVDTPCTASGLGWLEEKMQRRILSQGCCYCWYEGSLWQGERSMATDFGFTVLITVWSMNVSGVFLSNDRGHVCNHW